MKIANLIEASGEDVVKFSDFLNNWEDLNDEQRKAYQTIGSGLFKAGFKNPDTTEFKIKLDNGLEIEITLIYISNGRYGIHVFAKEKDKELQWDPVPMTTAVKLDFKKVVQTIDSIFSSIDEADSMFGTRSKVLV